jgi:hypothetical protein
MPAVISPDKTLLPPDRRHLIPCLVFFALVLPWIAGCHGPLAKKLDGTWELDVEAQGDKENDADIEDGTSTIVDAVAGGDSEAARMTLVFQKNGNLETITRFPSAGSHKHWKWSEVSWDEGKQTAVIRCEMGQETTQTVIVFRDVDTIELVPPNLDVLKTRLRFIRRQAGIRQPDDRG